MLKSVLTGTAVATIVIAANVSQAQSQTVVSVKSDTFKEASQKIAYDSPFEVERSIFEQINQYRVTRGLSRLTWNAQIAQQARQHSADMANRIIPFGHEGFDQRAKSISKSVGYRSVSENVAYMTRRQSPAAKAVKAWLESTKHRENIEGDFNMTGIGVSVSPTGDYYFTEVFIRK